MSSDWTETVYRYTYTICDLKHFNPNFVDVLVFISKKIIGGCEDGWKVKDLHLLSSKIKLICFHFYILFYQPRNETCNVHCNKPCNDHSNEPWNKHLGRVSQLTSQRASQKTLECPSLSCNEPRKEPCNVHRYQPCNEPRNKHLAGSLGKSLAVSIAISLAMSPATSTSQGASQRALQCPSLSALQWAFQKAPRTIMTTNRKSLWRQQVFSLCTWEILTLVNNFGVNVKYSQSIKLLSTWHWWVKQKWSNKKYFGYTMCHWCFANFQVKNCKFSQILTTNNHKQNEDY